MPSSESDLSQEEIDYALVAADRLNRVGEGSTQLGELFSEPDFTNETWQIQVVVILAEWQFFYEEVQGLTPPPRLAELHGLELQLYALLDGAADDFIFAFDNFDAERLAQGLTKIEEADVIIQRIEEVADNFGQTGPPTQAVVPLICAGMDAWEWAQSVYESDPVGYAVLDADGDGLACPELPRGGFAPAFWIDAIPDGLQEGTILAIIDGDTFEIAIDGVSNRFRLYRADTPETLVGLDCGGPDATAFAEWALSWNDQPGQVWIERESDTTDQYGRELGYVWFEIAGQPYLLNHVLVNNGWAEAQDYGYAKYDTEFADAAAFGEEHSLGVWGQCGGFGQAVSVAAPAQEPAPALEQAPVADSAAMGISGGGCDPNYTPCIPAYPPDLNCPDIGITVQRIGGDPHGLDRDGDGVGCE